MDRSSCLPPARCRRAKLALAGTEPLARYAARTERAGHRLHAQDNRWNIVPVPSGIPLGSTSKVEFGFRPDRRHALHISPSPLVGLVRKPLLRRTWQARARNALQHRAAIPHDAPAEASHPSRRWRMLHATPCICRLLGASVAAHAGAAKSYLKYVARGFPIFSNHPLNIPTIALHPAWLIASLRSTTR